MPSLSIFHIYRATSRTSGKSYVGKTVQMMRARRNGHHTDVRQGSKLPFHNALRKYGVADFLWEVICETTDEDDANDLEKHFIKVLNTMVPNGYNLTEGGEGCCGARRSEATRAKDRAAAAKRMNTAEAKARVSQASKQRWTDAESRAGMLVGYFKRSAAGAAATAAKYSKQWVITFPDGHEEVIYGLQQFCKAHGLTKSLMLAVAHGKQTHHKGFRLRCP